MPAMPPHAQSPLSWDAYMGLTKREHFAGLAMQGMLLDSEIMLDLPDIAKYSVRTADALLKELGK